MASDITFLIDVDNTLLDNDRILSDLHRQIEQELGTAGAQRYWAIFEAQRAALGYADYLGAMQLYRQESEHAIADSEQSGRGDSGSQSAPAEPADPLRMMRLSTFLLEYPFQERLYSRAIEVLTHLEKFGRTVILSDGDAVFQPHKVRGSGLWEAVDGRVLIYIHKQARLAEVQRLYPARHYVMIDDKLNILADMKAIWPDTLTTIFPRQGHYANDAAILAAHPPADFTIEHIGELADTDLSLLP